MSKVPGRLHATGGVLFILCGIAHTIGQFGPDGSSASMEKTMRTWVVQGTSMNFWNIMQCWGVLYGAMTILIGVMLLVVVNAAGGSAHVRKPAAVAGLLAAIVQAACTVYFNTPPPAFFMVPAALLLIGSAVWPERPKA